ncbi:hypothetical protein O4H66_27185 [Comamonadaceae bacterium G21597-S1]|nr:hypothetical protein [Comamonadaceae bacterium G21597-S1]
MARLLMLVLRDVFDGEKTLLAGTRPIARAAIDLMPTCDRCGAKDDDLLKRVAIDPVNSR